MPHIHAIVRDLKDKSVLDALQCYKKDVIFNVSQETGYRREDCALIPRVLTREEMHLSYNLLPLEFVVETGDNPFVLNDEVVNLLLVKIIHDCPLMKNIHFAVWVRGTNGNGFAEHKPTVAA